MATLRYLVSQPSTSTRALVLNYRNSLFTTDPTNVSLTAFSDNISTTFRDGEVNSVGLNIVLGLDTGAGSERISVSQVAKTRKLNPAFIDQFVGIKVGANQVFRVGPDSSSAARPVDSDSIGVTTLGTGSIGIDVKSDAELLTGLGDDSLVVTAAKTVVGATAVDATTAIVNYAGLESVAIKNAGRIDLGAGNDKVVADGSWRGLFNLDGKTVDFGAGADRLDAYGEDSCLGGTSAGIFNGTGSVIRMGSGDVTPPAGTATPNQSEKDLLTGIGTGHGAYIVEEYDPTQPGIYNAGTIYMGGGADVIDAISGGFAGSGTYDLGGDTSADTVAGFGAGTFKGGGGLDQLILPEGRYFASILNGLSTTLNRSVNVAIRKFGADPEVVMNLEGFEQVAGVADLAPTPFANGSRLITNFQVTADGNLEVI